MGRAQDGGGGVTSGMSDSVLRKVLLFCFYVAVWIILSSVIVYNKYILDPKMHYWPFPISITMAHMGFCSSLVVALVRVLHVVDLPTSPSMTSQLYIFSAIPIGTLYAMSLWFANSAYIYLSVSCHSSRCSRRLCPSPSSSRRRPSDPPPCSTCSPFPSVSPSPPVVRRASTCVVSRCSSPPSPSRPRCSCSSRSRSHPRASRSTQYILPVPVYRVGSDLIKADMNLTQSVLASSLWQYWQRGGLCFLSFNFICSKSSSIRCTFLTSW